MSKNTILYKGKEVPFNISKTLTYVKVLGSGGTGDTHLFYDEVAKKYFAIKKFSPKLTNDLNDCFKRFIDEIVILMDVSYKNIVRIYNYYLYPNDKLGYIQMEYIEGKTIDKFVPCNSKTFNDLFIDAIDSFGYLESKSILHRDIRPNNFLVTSENELKIIDFGFGKKYSPDEYNENSILLNWPVSQKPEEVEDRGEYDVRTEIYYLGCLFKNLIKDKESFLYNSILDKMSSVSLQGRYTSFKEIKTAINDNYDSLISFTSEEKTIYKHFAEELSDGLSSFTAQPKYEDNNENISKNLKDVLKNNSLEEFVQGNNQVLTCFIKSSYKYKTENNISVESLKKFTKLFTGLADKKKEIIKCNILSRLSTKKILISLTDDELPF